MFGRLSVCLLSSLLGVSTQALAQTTTFIDFTAQATGVCANQNREEIWGGLGLDRQGRVYVAILSNRYDQHLRGDVAIYRYTPATGQQECLTTLRTVSAAAGNLQPNERIGKVHTDIVEFGGKLYFASSDYHGGEVDVNERGSHIYSYDPLTNVWDDVTSQTAGGVVVANAGTLGIDILRPYNKLVGVTHTTTTSTSNQVWVYDLATHTKIVHARPATPSIGQATRRIWGTSLGKLYFSWLPQSSSDWSMKPYEWTVSAGNGLMQETPQPTLLIDGLLQGRQHTRDGTLTYLLDEQAGLYRWDVASEQLTSLGPILPGGRLTGGDVMAVFLLSNDARYFYTVYNAVLYQYRIATGTKMQLADFTADGRWGDSTGGVIDHFGNLYVGTHQYSSAGVNDNGAYLVKISGVATSPALGTKATHHRSLAR